MQAIVIATVHAKCLVTMAASITEYVPKDIPIYLSGCKMIFPRHQTILMENTAKNFGDAYNAVCNLAFQKHDEIVVCNDDIVFTPTTWQTLSEDVSRLKGENIPLGWVASRCDYARGIQNIRVGNGKMRWFRWETEDAIIETDIIAPICAYISKDAWVDYLPLDWYSDDVQCLDILERGRRNFVSTSYCHHVGSQTVGKNAEELIESAKPIIRKHRPKLYKKWFGKKK